jgi:diguanylate cyclase (GGDEF)-like protein
MFKLRSEHIRIHLHISIAVIVLCLLILVIPWIFKSYQQYQQTQRIVLELDALIAMSDLSEVMLTERMPANLLNNNMAAQSSFYEQQLQQHRDIVDAKMIKTEALLQQAGFNAIAWQLAEQLRPELAQARQAVDSYIMQPPEQRQLENFNQDIQKLFIVWDATHELLKKTLVESKSYDFDNTNHYAMLLIICDLQDQASRIAYYIKAPVIFEQPISAQQSINSLQNYQRAEYLWNLIAGIQPSSQRDVDFQRLHDLVKTEFLDVSQTMLQTLLQESATGQPYSYNAKQITSITINGFKAVLDLQRYVLNKHLQSMQKQAQKTKQEFILSCFVVSICLLAVLFAFLYTRHQVFLPLISARSMLLDLIDPDSKHDLKDSITLIGAIEKMKQTLKQRDALAFQLKNLANTDALTGVSNRVALDEYLNLKANQAHAFCQTALIVLDIDNFKQVNDCYGHLVGDDVIRHIADKLKAQVQRTDLVVRYGGDEFLVILENCPFSDALYLADEMRCAISHSVVQVEGQDDLMVSVSAGVAVGANSWNWLKLIKVC